MHQRVWRAHAPGRLLDLEDQAVVESPLAALGLDGRYRLSQHEARSGGLRGIRVDVQGLEDQPPHRHWSEIRDQIHAAALAPALKQTVLDVFTRLAEAEATVHGTSAEAVHFHEVGAIDALVDVVGVCAAMQNLNPAEVVCSPLPAGSGTVSTAHGVLPVPVPAVLELARRHRIPLLQGGDLPPGELVTPTGLSWCRCWQISLSLLSVWLPKRLASASAIANWIAPTWCASCCTQRRMRRKVRVGSRWSCGGRMMTPLQRCGLDQSLA